MRQLTAKEIDEEITEAQSELHKLDERAMRLWERIQIAPEQWSQDQYVGTGPAWVIGILGNRCLYLNNVEGGWGWGRFAQWGKINGYHWEQLEIEHVVLQTMFAIDNGGKG